MNSRVLRSLLAAGAVALAGCGASSSSGNGILAVDLVDARQGWFFARNLDEESLYFGHRSVNFDLYSARSIANPTG